MRKQGGGGFTVSGWLAILLLATAIAAGTRSCYLSQHRTINIGMPTVEYEYHTFPEGRGVCDGFNTICWISI